MNQAPQLPNSHQPDAEPVGLPPNPSLITYLVLVVGGVAMIVAALVIGHDLPGLFMNLGSSLISAVLVLIFIDRRLRRSEISALMAMPARVGVVFWLTVSPRCNQLYKFNLRQLAALGGLTESKVLSAAFSEVSNQQGSFILSGTFGSGKTTVLQMLCDRRGHAHRIDVSKPVPILYALRRWRPERTLDQAILEHMQGFGSVWPWSLKATMRKHGPLIILDGADEIFEADPNRLRGELERLRARYPRVTWIVSSRPEYLSPVSEFPTIDIRPPTIAEAAEINRLAT